MSSDFQFTSESVSAGHPDKIADQISDAILDAILTIDKNAKVACQCLVKTGLVFVAGELLTTAKIDYESVIRKTILKIGYDNSALGFDGNSCAVITSFDKPSPDALRLLYDNTPEQTAGDQCSVFGYACNETSQLMPAPIFYAHQLMQQHKKILETKSIPWLRPDAKCQITFNYKNHLPDKIQSIVFSTQHDESVTQREISQHVKNDLILPMIPPKFLSSQTRYFINPTGRFVVGGPMGDCGLTGRKIVVDTYGGMARNGGSALSGKDPSKMSRAATYYARQIAKSVVASNLAHRCEIQLAYCIAKKNPTSMSINTFGTSQIADAALLRCIQDAFDFTPFHIIKQLSLKQTLYSPLAAFGQIGREDLLSTWEIPKDLSC